MCGTSQPDRERTALPQTMLPASGILPATMRAAKRLLAIAAFAVGIIAASGCATSSKDPCDHWYESHTSLRYHQCRQMLAVKQFARGLQQMER